MICLAPIKISNKHSNKHKFLKRIANLNQRSILILSFIMAIFVFWCLTNYAKKTQNEISLNFLRLHVLANSDSTEDQNLKLKVRDKFLKAARPLLKSSLTIADNIEILNQNSAKLTEVLEKEVSENGYQYDVKTNIGTYMFPTKTYKDIRLPAGPYEAVRIEIGKAAGQNWWCVLFPPLCLVDGINAEISKDEIDENIDLSEKKYELISTDARPSFKIKFKIIELFAPFFSK